MEKEVQDFFIDYKLNMELLEKLMQSRWMKYKCKSDVKKRNYFIKKGHCWVILSLKFNLPVKLYFTVWKDYFLLLFIIFFNWLFLCGFSSEWAPL